MAQRIDFHTPPRDPRAALHARVERAPEEHAEAVLAAYDVLQQLHERGILQVVQSALAAGDELLDQAVRGADTPETVRAIRNLLLLGRVLGSTEPESLQRILQAIPDGVTNASAQRSERVTLWKIVRQAMSKDSLRGLAAVVGLLQSVGRHLHTPGASASGRQS